MPAKKSTSSATKLTDVADPDTIKTDATSVPIIVMNRAILKDPMMAAEKVPEKTEDKPADTTKKAKSAPFIKKIELKPLAEDTTDLVSIEEDVPDEKSDDEKVVVRIESKPAAASEPEKPISVPAAQVAADEASTDKQPATPLPSDKKESAPATPEPLAAPAKTAASETATENPAGQKDENSTDTGETKDAPDDLLTDAKPVDAKAAKAAREAAEKQLALEKLVADGTYVLPVNAVEKRRVHRTILVVLLIVLALGIAGFMLALDAGYVHIDGLSAPTDLVK